MAAFGKPGLGGGARARKKLRTVSLKKGYERSGGYYGRYAPYGNEMKFFDTALAGGAIDSTGEVITGGQLCLIPQGTAENNRIGRKCVIRKIHFKGAVTHGTTNSNTFIRICIVLDKQCNGAAAAYTDLFTSSSAIQAYRNLANSERFEILKDWYWGSGATATSTSDNWATSGNTIFYHPVKTLKWSHKCNIPLEFSSTTGAITEIKTNNIFVTAISSTDDVPLLTFTCRLRFSDN